MDAQIAKLKEWVDASDNIVFFGGAGVSPKVESRISARWMVCTTNNTSIRRKPF